MTEIYLTHRELKELLEIVETMNPPGTLGPQSGIVKVGIDSSSGIGSVVTATVPVKQGDRWGDWTTTITDEENW